MRVVLQNARVLGPDGFADGPLAVDGAHLVDDLDAPAVDLRGYRLLPGIVDLHGDGFERHLAPRRGAVMDPRAGLAATEAELAANGITTAVLAQFLSWEGGMRGPEFASRLAQAVQGFDARLDLRLQWRLETSLVEAFDRCADLAGLPGAGYVVFNDHLPHAALAAGRRPPRLTGQALKAGRSPEAHLALLQDLHARDLSVALPALADRLAAQGVLMGSHDDATPEGRARFRALGARVAEFPETRAAAEAAHAAGDVVVMGAPNVLRGASHKGNLRATDLIAEGLCDVLVSDYHYPAPLGAVCRLVRDGVCDWPAAWRLVSEAPAQALGLTDRGRLVPGARADLIALDAEDRVALCLSAGRVAYLAGPLAERFLDRA